MGSTPAKVDRIIVVLEDSHWTTTDPWSCTPSRKGYKRQDLGSVNAPPPLDHRDSGVGWSRATVDCFEDRDPSTPRKDIMNREKILIEHWRWLEARGYKEQAASCKLQAASLTRKHYNDIKSYKRKDKKI
jgi:hypothetical protein